MGKSGYLMLVAVGPVQDFINEARKTRDLWFGSHVLSQISKAVAYDLKKEGAELIFPAPESLDDLQQESELTVVNKIALLVPEGTEPQAFADIAKEAAKASWKEYANDVYSKEGIKESINLNIWNQQINDLIECYIVWVPLEEKNYGQTWERADLLLVGRKTLHDFGFARKGKEEEQNYKNYPPEGISKSSLSGARESVLLRNAIYDRKRLALKEKEQLDAVGLVKRLGGTTEKYPSVSRIAIDPWLRGVQEAGDELKQIKDIFKKEKNICGLDTGKYGQFINFPYDTEILLPSRIDQYQEVFTHPKNWGTVKKNISVLWKKYGEPLPYLAIIKADGDKMGATISALKSMEEHQKFSYKLSKFANGVKKVVADYNGALVYSGGDDVFAFVPVDNCLSVARELHVAFGELMSEFKGEDKTNRTLSEGKKDSSPTLSVGIAIAHCLEPIEDLRTMAREAEMDAKLPDRNGLAIHFRSRSGADAVKVRKQWDKELDKSITDWANLILSEDISAQTAFDLRQLYLDYVGWSIDGEVALSKELLEKDTTRILKKKKPRGGNLLDTVSDLLQEIEKPESLLELSKKLLLASVLAKSMRQANPVKYRSVKEGVL